MGSARRASRRLAPVVTISLAEESKRPNMLELKSICNYFSLPPEQPLQNLGVGLAQHQ